MQIESGNESNRATELKIDATDSSQVNASASAKARSDQAYDSYLSEYQKELIKWQRNVDQRYAWVVLAALWLSMLGTFGPYRIYGLIYARTTSVGIYTREEASEPIAMTFTVDNLVSPLVSLVASHFSIRVSVCLGGILLVLSNVLATFSQSLWLDVLLIGGVQGVGIAFSVLPLMELINCYFVAYRSSALGVALTGATASILVLSPLVEWLLDNYPWRYAYCGSGLVCVLVVAASPFFKQHTKPKPPRQRAFAVDKPQQTGEVFAECLADLPDRDKPEFSVALLISILKKPAFHLIWFYQLTYFWVFSIYSIVLVDYGIDRGCSAEEADSLLMFLSVGEIIGRVLLPILVDMKLLSLKKTVALNLLAEAAFLVINTQLTGYYSFAIGVVALYSFISLSYILLNILIVEHMGERLVTISYGFSCFICGFLIYFRSQAVGYFRDYMGTYDPLMVCLALLCAFTAFLWLIEPWLTRLFSRTKTGDDHSDN